LNHFYKKFTFITFLLLSFYLTSSFAQTERWIYTHNGSGNDADEAKVVVYGADGNIYAAGYSNMGNAEDFTVISLTPSGIERWVYWYNGIGDSTDIAYSIVYGLDGNIYAAGKSYSDSTSDDFTVISLTSSGTERWVYRYNGEGNGNDVGNSIVYGQDGNIYIAGSNYSDTILCHFTVLSLDTSGIERWVYWYNDSLWYSGSGAANSLIYGTDGNIYAAGHINNWVTLDDFAVVSLDTAGVVRWMVLRDGNTITPPDIATSVVYGLDENIYAAGFVGTSTLSDYVVMSIDTAGAWRWGFNYNGSANSYDRALSMTYGADNNIYTTGYITGSGSSNDFTVISLTNGGDTNWIYIYNGPGNNNDVGNSVAYGSDENIYAAGWSSGNGAGDDFTVISLDTTGSERWVYRYDGQGNGLDRAFSIVYAADNYIYAAGCSYASSTSEDFTVISLDPTTGIEETTKATMKYDYKITIFSGPLQLPEGKKCKVFDITGRVVEPTNITRGIYFIEVDGKITRKVVKVR